MASNAKQPYGSTDEYLIRAVSEDFVRYHEARNIAKLMSLFTEDGRIMAPFRASKQGKTGLRESLVNAFSQYDQKRLRITTIYVEASGHVAFGFGTYEVNLKTNGKRIDDRGKWLVCLRRIATTWKIVAQCWNSDLPLTAFMRRKRSRP